MRKTGLWILGFGLISLTLFGSIVWASQTGWDLFKSHNGVLQVQGGVVTLIPGEKEKMNVVNSINPSSGIPLNKLNGAKPIGKEDYNRIIINESINGTDTKFVFDVAYSNGKPVVLNNNDQPYISTSIPQSFETVIQYQENLYKVNFESGSIIKMLKDRTDQYDLSRIEEQFSELQLDDTSLVWGAHPSFNSTGSRMVFFSNRNAIHSDNTNGQLWVKNLITGTEESVIEWTFEILGWDSDNSVVVKQADRLARIDLKTGKLEVIQEFSLASGFAYPYLVFQSVEKQVQTMNLLNKNYKEFTFEELNLIHNIEVNENTPWIAFFNVLDRTKPDRTLILLNVETEENVRLVAPSNSSFQYLQWIDESQFIVVVSEQGSSIEKSYIVILDQISRR